MKATELLQKQHREIEQLLERLETAGPEDEKAIREALASTLVAHTVIEEEIFYPAAREHAPDLVLEAREEHALADYELARELGTRAGDSTSRAKATVLADVVVRHIRKEESDLFKRVDVAMTNQELAELGEQMAARFQEVNGKGFSRFLTAALVENAPKLVGRPALSKAATRRAAPAKKKARRSAKATAAKRSTAKRSTAKRGTAKRSTAKRGAAKRGAAKRTAEQAAPKAQTTRRAPAKRAAPPKRRAVGAAPKARKATGSGARTRAAR